MPLSKAKDAARKRETRSVVAQEKAAKKRTVQDAEIPTTTTEQARETRERIAAEGDSAALGGATIVGAAAESSTSTTRGRQAADDSPPARGRKRRSPTLVNYIDVQHLIRSTFDDCLGSRPLAVAGEDNRSTKFDVLSAWTQNGVDKIDIRK
jgi:hypothetical protein